MKYSKALADKILNLVATGDYTIKDICARAGIKESTYYKWKSEKSEFSEAYKKAETERLNAFGNMAKSGLAKLLDVHEYEEVTTEWVEGKPNKDGTPGKPKIKSQKKIKKFIMPNATAVIFTLTNRLPEDWKQKQSVEHTGEGGEPLEVIVKYVVSNAPEPASNEKDVLI